MLASAIQGSPGRPPRRICALLLLFASSQLAVAPEGIGSANVTVEVSDALGGAVRNARISVLERSAGHEKEQVTDETGKAIVELQPGAFDLTVTSPGFLASMTHYPEVKAGEHLRLKVVLKVKMSDCCIDPVDPPVELERAKPGDLEEPIERITTQATKQYGCLYMHSRGDLSGFESGGPYVLEHFRLTKGQTDLREFLWTHWREHKKGVAEAMVETIDAGTVNVLYVIQADAKGRWGVDKEIARPMDPACVAFHADRLVRKRVRKPDDDNAQTMGFWPTDKLPRGLLSDSDVKSPRMYQIILVSENKPMGGII